MDAEAPCDATRRGPGLDRREFVRAGAATLAGALLPGGCAAPRDRPPDLLLFLTDDQHSRAVGYASDGAIFTPNIDRMAARGTRFDAAYCNAMPCTPSRGSLMSGLHFHRFQHMRSSRAVRLRPGEWTWAHALRQANYRTVLIGKMHFAPMRADHGFEHAEYCEHKFRRAISPGNSPADDYEGWLALAGLQDRQEPELGLWPYDEKYHPISWIRDRAIVQLERPRVDRQPLCLTIGFRHPHPPFKPGGSFAARYDPRAMAIPNDTWNDMRGLPEKLWKYDREGFYPRSHFSHEILQLRFAYYYALVTQIDDAIGAILEHVDLDNTLVLFTSDHGVYMGRRGRVDKNPYLHFEPVGRVPFVACGAGVRRGAIVDHPIGLIDVAPTFLTAAGLAVPRDLDGVALQTYFRDPRAGAGRALFGWGLTEFNMIRRGTHKYFRSHDRSEEMLFDLSSDPGELENLAGREDQREIQAGLTAEMDAVEARGPTSLPRFRSSPA